MARTAFVTGATGFLGAFFTAQLLRQGLQVFALVRNAPERSLLPTIDRIGGTHRDFPKDPAASFTSIDGNVRASGCGLGECDAERIAATTTDVWHFAATFEDQSNGGGDVYATNVGGTENLLKYLESFKQPVRLNYVSTAYAAPVENGVAFERLSEPGDVKGNQYEATKAEAERRIAKFCQARNLEFRIFRPPIVAGESGSGLSLGFTGYQGVFRALYLLTRRLEINIGPSFDRDLRLRVIADPSLPVNVVPVDFVTEAMWRIAESERSAGGIYNITSAHTVELATLFRSATESLKVDGITLSTNHDFEAQPITMAERLFRRRMKFQEPYFLRCSHFDTADFRRNVTESEMSSPMVEPDYLARCNQYCLDALAGEFATFLDDASGGPLAESPDDAGPAALPLFAT